MIKKVIKSMAIALLAVVAVSCADGQKKDCMKIVTALATKDYAKVDELSNKLYSDLPGCTVETLGTLTCSYLGLCETATSDDAQKDYLRRAVECYDMAKEKDPEAAKKMFDELAKQLGATAQGVTMDQVMDLFRMQLNSPESAQIMEEDQENTELRDTDINETIAVSED